MRKNMELKYDVEIPKRIDNKNDEIRRLILEFINSGSQTAEILMDEKESAKKMRQKMSAIITRDNSNCKVVLRGGRIFLAKKEPSDKRMTK